MNKNLENINIPTHSRGTDMNLIKKIKNRLIKCRYRKQIDFMWEIKEKEEIKQDLFEIYLKNIIWIKIGNNPMIPYYYIEEEGRKFAKIPYAEIDMNSYFKNGNIIINKFMNVKN